MKIGICDEMRPFGCEPHGCGPLFTDNSADERGTSAVFIMTLIRNSKPVTSSPKKNRVFDCLPPLHYRIVHVAPCSDFMAAPPPPRRHAWPRVLPQPLSSSDRTLVGVQSTKFLGSTAGTARSPTTPARTVCLFWLFRSASCPSLQPRDLEVDPLVFVQQGDRRRSRCFRHSSARATPLADT